MAEGTDYPHWRVALFGNGHVANLYCAGKYGIWHGSRVIAALLLLLLYPLSYIPFSRVYMPVAKVITSDTAVKIYNWIIKGVVGLFALVILAWAVWTILIDLDLFFKTVGFITTVLVIILAVIYIVDWLWEHFPSSIIFTYLFAFYDLLYTSVNKTRDKPIVRRIYGHCPVSMSMNPVWFEKLTDKLGIE